MEANVGYLEIEISICSQNRYPHYQIRMGEEDWENVDQSNHKMNDELAEIATELELLREVLEEMLEFLKEAQDANMRAAENMFRLGMEGTDG